LVQFLCSNYISVELTDVLASLASVASMVIFLRVWQPSEPLEGERQGELGGGPHPAVAGASTHDPALEAEIGRRDRKADTPGEILRGYAPYLIIIAVFALAQWGPIKDFLAGRTKMFDWPGLHVTNDKGEAVKSLTFKFDWLAAAGTLLLISGLLTMAALRVKPRAALTAYGATLNQLKWAILTVAAVLSLAYVMNQSGQSVTMGLWAAGAGGAFAFFSPAIGWLGTAITGSDTSSNSLFGALQVAAAKDAGINPLLLAAGNSSGGVLGKMISPQNLAIGAAAVGMGGREGDLFRQVLKWSVLLILIMCVLVYLQSTSVLSWMIP
ncbi:MAG: lactate permease, partial [Pseudonocardiales bacterium]|nr:lactate permease [Pseudonocardiales bacterium]